MTEYILNPGDIITVAGENPLGCLGTLVVGLMLCAVIGSGYDNKKPNKQVQPEAKPEIQKKIEYRQEYIIDPDKIDNSPIIDSQLENIIDPDAVSTIFLLNRPKSYQIYEGGHYHLV